MEITKEQRKRAETNHLATLAKLNRPSVKASTNQDVWRLFRCRKISDRAIPVVPLEPKNLSSDMFLIIFEICSPDAFSIMPEPLEGFAYPREIECLQKIDACLSSVLFGRRLGSDVRLVLAESIHGGSLVHVILEHRVFGFDKNALVSDEWATDTVEFEIRSLGLHLAINACATAAVAVSLGVPLYQVGESLSRFEPVHMRSELEIAENGIRIINDVYNANPTSMRAAIDLLIAMDCRGKRVAILGDMLELGTTDAEAHKIVLNMCCDASFGLIACVGKRFHLAAENLNLLGNDNVMCAVDSKSITLKVRERLADVDVVLVKGSPAMQMERVVDAIKDISI